ncbi:unnamed protein product [Brassica oleracea var. botrytis]
MSRISALSSLPSPRGGSLQAPFLYNEATVAFAGIPNLELEAWR